jgi:hypothetical protein
MVRLGWGAITAAVLVAGTALAAEQAGVSAAVRGSVLLSREQLVGRQVASGEPLYLQDAIESGASSGMQILLLDETVFTLGAQSSLVIDEFVYDPGSGTGELSAQVVKGAFRFVTGRIAQEEPRNVNLRLPAGTVGIRGTIVAGLADPGDGSSLVVLLGPGRDNNTGARPGAVRVSNAGRAVDLRRPNFATRIGGWELPPSEPFEIGPEELERLLGQLAGGGPVPSGAGVQAQGEPASEAAGQTQAEGAAYEEIHAAAEEDNRTGSVLAGAAAQDQLLPLFELATVDELAAITSGVAHFDQPGVPLSDGGSLELFVSVDFGTQNLFLDLLDVTSPTLGLPGGVIVSGMSAPLASGQNGLAFYPLSTGFAGGGGICATFCNAFVDASLLTAGSLKAAAADIRLEDGGGTFVVTGTGFAPEQ